MVKVSMCGSSASCAYGKAGSVNDILFDLGCKDNKGLIGLGFIGLVFWGYLDIGNKSWAGAHGLFALKNDFMRSDASSASNPVRTCVLG